MNLKTNVEGTISWQKIVAKYAHPDLRKSLWQMINTLIPFCALFYLTMRSVDISLWLTIPLSRFSRRDLWCGPSSSFTTADTVRISNRSVQMIGLEL